LPAIPPNERADFDGQDNELIHVENNDNLFRPCIRPSSTA
jgi:hypothetical protein